MNNSEAVAAAVDDALEILRKKADWLEKFAAAQDTGAMQWQIDDLRAQLNLISKALFE